MGRGALISGIISNFNGSGTAGSLAYGGSSTLTLTNTNTYTGSTIIRSGTISVASIGNSGVSGNLGAGTTINLGSTTTTGTLLYTGSGETTSKVINLNGSTGGGKIDQSGTGTLTFSSNFTANTNGAKTLTLQGSSAGTGVISGKIIDSASGATTLVKDGTGTWTLSGANTYTGGTTINQGTLTAAVGSLVSVVGGITVNSGGTLLLSGAGRHIGNAVPVTLNGGTFNTGGFSEPGGALDGTNHIGALTLTATSTIDFGTGSSSILEFGGLGAHTATTILNIINWDGVVVVGGSGDRLLFNGLVADFIAKYDQNDVTFDGVTGYTTIQTSTGPDAFYEVVGLAPIPEPSTWIGAALALGAMGVTQRKRFAKRLRVIS